MLLPQQGVCAVNRLHQDQNQDQNQDQDQDQNQLQLLLSLMMKSSFKYGFCDLLQTFYYYQSVIMASTRLNYIFI